MAPTTQKQNQQRQADLAQQQPAKKVLPQHQQQQHHHQTQSQQTARPRQQLQTPQQSAAQLGNKTEQSSPDANKQTGQPLKRPRPEDSADGKTETELKQEQKKAKADHGILFRCVTSVLELFVNGALGIVKLQKRARDNAKQGAKKVAGALGLCKK